MATPSRLNAGRTGCPARPLTVKGGTTTSGVMRDLIAYGGRVLAGGALMVNVALVVDDYIKASPWEGPELIPAVATSTSSGPAFTMAGVGDLPNPAVYLIAERMKTRAIAGQPPPQQGTVTSSSAELAPGLAWWDW